MSKTVSKKRNKWVIIVSKNRNKWVKTVLKNRNKWIYPWFYKRKIVSFCLFAVLFLSLCLLHWKWINELFWRYCFYLKAKSIIVLFFRSLKQGGDATENGVWKSSSKKVGVGWLSRNGAELVRMALRCQI